MEMGRTRSILLAGGELWQRGLVGKIIERFEQRGYHLQGLKLFQASEELLKTHYCDLVEKPFFPGLLEYMLSGPVTWCAVAAASPHHAPALPPRTRASTR